MDQFGLHISVQERLKLAIEFMVKDALLTTATQTIPIPSPLKNAINKLKLEKDNDFISR